MLSPPLASVVGVVATTVTTGTPQTAIEFTECELERTGHERAQIGQTQQHQRDSFYLKKKIQKIRENGNQSLKKNCNDERWSRTLFDHRNQKETKFPVEIRYLFSLVSHPCNALRAFVEECIDTSNI